MNGTVLWGWFWASFVAVLSLVQGACNGFLGVYLLGSLLIWAMWGFFALARYYFDQAALWRDLSRAAFREMIAELQSPTATKEQWAAFLADFPELQEARRAERVRLLGRHPW